MRNFLLIDIEFYNVRSTTVGRDYIRLLKVRVGTRRRYELPSSPTVARHTQAEFHAILRASQSVDERGEILKFAVSRSRDVRMGALSDGAPCRQAHVSTRGDALKWKESGNCARPI